MTAKFNGMLLSKVFWLNLLMAFVVIADGEDVKQFVSMESLVKIQAGLNIVLRLYTRVAVEDKTI